MRFLSLSDRCSVSKVRQTRSGSARAVDKAASCLFVVKRAGKLDKIERDAVFKLIRRFTIRGWIVAAERRDVYNRHYQLAGDETGGSIAPVKRLY